MKKLIFALSAALLLLSACGEKTYKFEKLKFAIPEGYTLESKEVTDDGMGIAYIQHDKITSNSLNLFITPLDMDKVKAASTEEIEEYLKQEVTDMWEIYIQDDDDFKISTKSDLQTDEDMAWMFMTGYAYDEYFTGEMISVIYDEYCITGFVSAQNEEDCKLVRGIMLSCME